MPDPSITHVAYLSNSTERFSPGETASLNAPRQPSAPRSAPPDSRRRNICGVGSRPSPDPLARSAPLRRIAAAGRARSGLCRWRDIRAVCVEQHGEPPLLCQSCQRPAAETCRDLAGQAGLTNTPQFLGRTSGAVWQRLSCKVRQRSIYLPEGCSRPVCVLPHRLPSACHSAGTGLHSTRNNVKTSTGGQCMVD
jgi:hypothetical protein